jgi:GNAT superfamily N-acetyltransferase
VFRAAQIGDFAGIMRLYRQLLPEDPAVDDGTDVTVFERIQRSDWLHLFVLERASIVVATTYLNIVPNLTRSVAPYAVVENVVVDEALRGTGLGRQIMAGTLRAAWDAGCDKAMLMTGSRRPETHAFYRSCGFSGDAKTAYLARPPSS